MAKIPQTQKKRAPDLEKMSYDQLLRVLDIYCMGYVSQEDAARGFIEKLGEVDDLEGLNKSAKYLLKNLTLSCSRWQVF